MTALPDDIRLEHMLDAAESAVSFIAGRARSDLDTDTMLKLALVKCIEIVGEASSQISDDYKERHPTLPWAVMKGIRNRLVHAYFDVDLDIVWTTVTENLPPLIQQLTKIVEDETLS